MKTHGNNFSNNFLNALFKSSTSDITASNSNPSVSILLLINASKIKVSFGHGEKPRVISL